MTNKQLIELVRNVIIADEADKRQMIARILAGDGNMKKTIIAIAKQRNAI